MTRPIWSDERTAARLLDMKPGEFRSLVEAGHLPQAYELAPGVRRWNTAGLEKIASGDAADGRIGW